MGTQVLWCSISAVQIARAEITRDFPAFPEKSKAAKKRELVQGSVIEGRIENLRPMPPDKRVSVKMTDCISNYCNLNNRTLDMVNDIGFIREMAAANPCYQFYSRTYMTKTKLLLRYAAAVRRIRNILDAQTGGWFTFDVWSTENASCYELPLFG